MAAHRRRLYADVVVLFRSFFDCCGRESNASPSFVGCSVKPTARALARVTPAHARLPPTGNHRHHHKFQFFIFGLLLLFVARVFVPRLLCQQRQQSVHGRHVHNECEWRHEVPERARQRRRRMIALLFADFCSSAITTETAFRFL
jgi:hypothetical protein